MDRYKLVISYDGTHFMGWQVQDNLPTIAGTLEKSYKKVFNQTVTVLGASRTDAGVHAYGQVALLRTPQAIDPQRMKGAWNKVLPPSIMIVSCDLVQDSFHPFYNVVQKEYWYQFFVQAPTPFGVRYGWHYTMPVDIDKLNRALSLFVGTHDFRAFCTGIAPELLTELTIDSITLEVLEFEQGWRIIIKGKKFLHHMIRRIVGAALHVASRPELGVETIVKVLNSKNPSHALPTAAPQGLILKHIVYK